MVNTRERVFLVCGSDFFQRQLAVNNLKKRILKNRACVLNTFIFYSQQINLPDLKEKLFLVSFGQSKILIFKDVFSLDSTVTNFLYHNLKQLLNNNYIIFETDRSYFQIQNNRKFSSDKLFSFILKQAALIKVASAKRKASIEDFIISLRKKDLANSLYILESLFVQGVKDKILGPQIMGILVKNFSFRRDYLKKDKYFNHFWEADRAMKEKGAAARLVIETLLVKLAALDQKESAERLSRGFF